MRAAKLLINELNKNFRLLFRNWTAIALLIVAPLLLILLVGYAFSGDELHDINIGFVSDSETSIDSFLSNISDFASAVKYSDSESCLADMRTEKVHLCLTFTGTFVPSKDNELPDGDVKFYFDNSRKSLSTAIVSNVKDFFGLQSEQISLISAQTVILNVQNLLAFISDRVSEIEEVKNTAHEIRNDMAERKQELIQVREDFLPKYELAKQLQTTLNNYTYLMNDSKNTIDNETETMKQLLRDTEIILAELYRIVEIPEVYTELNNTTYNLSELCNMTLDSETRALYNLSELCKASANITFPVYYPVISGVQNITFAKLYAQLDVISDTTDSTYEQISKLNSDYDETMAELDRIKLLLDNEIERSDYYIALIDESITEIDNVYASLEEKMSSLTNLDPGIAAKIVKPITQEFQELISGIRNEQIAFPVLLTSIVVFISLLFSNVVTLLEINNKAYLRNIISPANDAVFTTGLALTNFIVVSFQVFVLFMVAQFGFRMNVFSNLPALVPVIALLALVFIFLGMTISYISKNSQSSILMTTFVALGFFLFSNAVTSLEAMPKLAAAVAQFNPVVIANSAVKKILIYNLPLVFSASEVIVLAVYAASALILVAAVSKIKNRKRF